MPTVDLLANDYPDVILAARNAPCLSLYQPTHRQHPASAQDPIRFRNLIRLAIQSLEQKYPECAAESLLAPLHALAGDVPFWKRGCEGLAVLLAPDFLRVYRLQRPVAEQVVVADRFHSKPLLRIMQSADRYQVLGLNRHAARLFEGNRDHLDEIELAPEVQRTLAAALGREPERDRATRTYGAIKPGAMGRHGASDGKQEGIRADTERFFRAVDHGVASHHSLPTGLPLLLAALPEHHALFRETSRNPQLLAASLDVHPEDLSLDELRQRAWQQVQPRYLERLAGLVDSFHAASHRGQATDDLAAAATAAQAGRVATLLIEAERYVPGRRDAARGVPVGAAPDDLAAGDLLDALGEQVLATGGEVVVVPAERMPTDSGLAAIHRF